MREMKDSGVEGIGLIPDDWQVTRIKNLFLEINERCVSGSENQLLSVSEYYGVAPREQIIIGDDLLTHAASLDGYKKCKQYDLVMNIMLAWKHALGITDYEGIVSPAYCIYRAKKPIIERYYHYLFRTDAYASIFKQYSTGIIDSRLRLYPNKFLGLKCIMPTLNEQYKIVNYLDYKCSKIDSIISKQEQIIEKLETYKVSVITEAVTKGIYNEQKMKESGIEWIGMIPQRWSIHKFCWDYSAELGKMLDAKRITGNYFHPYIKNIDVQWDSINFENLDEMDFEESEHARYGVKPGDLMICEGGEIGKCAIVPTDAPVGIYYQKALHRVRPRDKKKGNIRFLFYIMFTMAKNGCLNTSPEKATIAHLPGDALSQLRIPTPPIKEQKQIAEYLDKKCKAVDVKINAKNKLIKKLQDYKKSLIYECVTGKKEVPVQPDAFSKTGINPAVLEQIRNHAKSCGIHKVILFGSRARGTFHRDSDIDLAVSGGNVDLFRLAVEEETDTLLTYDVVNLDRTSNEELLDVIRKEGVIIYEEV